MNKFVVTIFYDGARFEVHGSDSKAVAATHEAPADGGIEDIERVYLLSDGKRVELPDFLQTMLDEKGCDGDFDDEINDALKEMRKHDPEDHE